MITADFSQLLIAGCLEDKENFQKGGNVKQMENIARHRTLASIQMYRKRHKEKYGEIVLCCDGDDYWRTKFFPHYKGKRKANKKDSTIDWASLHAISDQIREEFREVFPYKVVRVSEGEADDVIACLTKYLQTNELSIGLDERPQLILNISADHDFRQLYEYPNYSQHSPIQKKIVPRADKNFLLEKILKGDANDGVPGVRSTDDQFMRGERQPPISAKMLANFLANPDGSTLDEFERKNLERNRILIDFKCIPPEVDKAVIDTYLACKPTGKPGDAFNYFIKHRERQFMQDIPSFYK